MKSILYLILLSVFFVHFNQTSAVIPSQLKELKEFVVRKLHGNDGYRPISVSEPLLYAHEKLSEKDAEESICPDREEDLLGFIKHYWAYELSFFDKN
jgi:hypothetical protein